MNTKIYSQQDLENTATELRRVHTWELVIFCAMITPIAIGVGFVWGMSL
jgi:hypothetical protein